MCSMYNCWIKKAYKIGESLTCLWWFSFQWQGKIMYLARVRDKVSLLFNEQRELVCPLHSRVGCEERVYLLKEHKPK